MSKADTGFHVAPSPLNAVKFELGVILVVALLLWFSLDSITQALSQQLLVLGGFGLSALLWIVLRVRRALRRLAPNS